MRTSLLKTLADLTTAAPQGAYEVVDVNDDMIVIIDNKEGTESEVVLEDKIELRIGDQIDGEVEWVDEDLQGLSKVKIISREG